MACLPSMLFEICDLLPEFTYFYKWIYFFPKLVTSLVWPIHGCSLSMRILGSLNNLIYSVCLVSIFINRVYGLVNLSNSKATKLMMVILYIHSEQHIWLLLMADLEFSKLKLQVN